MTDPVERVVEYLYEQYDQPISLEDMAGVAYLSQFYFARMFREATGVTPSRFLSAVRLQRAKELLLTTPLTSTDISYMVGYNSLGTFTSRFTASVGISPVQYRRQGQIDLAPAPLDDGGTPPPVGTLAGRFSTPEVAGSSMRAYLGVFDSPIVQGMPVACALVDSSMTFRLDPLPEGEWYLSAAAIDMDDPPISKGGARPARLMGRVGPLKVLGGQSTVVNVEMRHALPTDPPVLLALPGLEGCTKGS